MAHKDDCPDQAITNKYILRWSENDDIRPKIREDERDAYFANTVHTGYSAIGYSAKSVIMPICCFFGPICKFVNNNYWI